MLEINIGSKSKIKRWYGNLFTGINKMATETFLLKEYWNEWSLEDF